MVVNKTMFLVHAETWFRRKFYYIHVFIELYCSISGPIKNSSRSNCGRLWLVFTEPSDHITRSLTPAVTELLRNHDRHGTIHTTLTNSSSVFRKSLPRQPQSGSRSLSEAHTIQRHTEMAGIKVVEIKCSLVRQLTITANIVALQTALDNKMLTLD